MKRAVCVCLTSLLAAACSPETKLAAPDLAIVADLATTADLTVVPDLRGPPDLVVVDLAPPDDLVPPPVVVTTPHWRQTFGDEFRGKEGKPSDDYCFDQLLPQCHVWAGTSHNCDLSDVAGLGFYPPTRANLVAAIHTIDPTRDVSALDEAGVKTVYGQLLAPRLAALNKCNWTMYEMVNWMATDYAGHWSARMDASQVEVDPAGKGHLLLSAAYAPVATDCIYGGTLGGPNCLLYAFGAGELDASTTYTVDTSPASPSVYYAATGTTCPHGGTLDGTRCRVYTFAPNVLETSDVSYWVDPNPAYPGVYYVNQTYRCKDNIDYTPALGFRNLTCPILNGALMSYPFTNRQFVDGNGTSQPRGAAQRQGRFEAKARIPKGLGSFPATWLMPLEGGWPYKGGEIDVMEARDAANEVYQTYHHGKCYSAADNSIIDAADSADCATKSGTSTHLSKGFTSTERTANEFWKRDHLFAAEWRDNRIDYFINNVKIGSIEVGTEGTLDPGAPAALAGFASANFPTSPFYWILNHSTYVSPSQWATFAKQTFAIDYVRNFGACGTDNAEYCPCGGRFTENVGCTLDAAILCPAGMAIPTVTNNVYRSPCQPSARRCINGGVLDGSRCVVQTFAPGAIETTIDYSVDIPAGTVYYTRFNNGCPFGGTDGGGRCTVATLAADVLESGVDYQLDDLSTPQVLYYVPDFDY